MSSDNIYTPDCINSFRDWLEMVEDQDSLMRKIYFIWGDLYEYSKTRYTKSSEKIIVTCKIHGDFETIPTNFTKGHGCRDCAILKRAEQKNLKAASEYMDKVKAVHGDTYDYSKTKYINGREKITVTCKIHGDFEQTPHSHLRSGCDACARIRKWDKRRIDSKEFKRRFEEKFGREIEILSYTKFREIAKIRIVDSGDVVELIPQSAIDYSVDGSKIFGNMVTDANSLQYASDEKFGWYVVCGDYDKSRLPVMMLCKIHNMSFEISPNGHMNSSYGGCPSCTSEVLSKKATDRNLRANEAPDQECHFYHIRLFDGNEKIGITTKTVEERFKCLSYELLFCSTSSFSEAVGIERSILEELGDERYKVRTLKNTRFGGWTECFRQGVIEESKTYQDVFGSYKLIQEGKVQ